jgi:hypothetical protein
MATQFPRGMGILLLASAGFGAGIGGVGCATRGTDLMSPMISIPGPQSESSDRQWRVAEELYATGELRQGLREFSRIGRLQRELGLNAGATYWKIAEIRVALGNQLGAALALDVVAREADRFGEAELHARALFEAANYYSAAGRRVEAADRLRRFELAVASPYVGEELRASLQERRKDG